MTDEEFFSTHRDRNYRIRLPSKILTKTKQRAMHYEEECDGEFRSLGDHKKDRRRLIIWRIPPDNPWYNPDKQPLMKIPMLLNADETVEDRDDILDPIFHEIMEQAQAKFARMQ
jgi:hypothetical protein